MKVVQLNESAPRDACLARLCAEVYGQAAGLTPLVRFAATRLEQGRLVDTGEQFVIEADLVLRAIGQTYQPQAAGSGIALTLIGILLVVWKPGGFERGGNTKTHGIVRAEFNLNPTLVSPTIPRKSGRAFQPFRRSKHDRDYVQ